MRGLPSTVFSGSLLCLSICSVVFPGCFFPYFTMSIAHTHLYLLPIKQKLFFMPPEYTSYALQVLHLDWVSQDIWVIPYICPNPIIHIKWRNFMYFSKKIVQSILWIQRTDVTPSKFFCKWNIYKNVIEPHGGVEDNGLNESKFLASGSPW